MFTPTLSFAYSSPLLSHLSFFPLTLLCLLYEGKGWKPSYRFLLLPFLFLVSVLPCHRSLSHKDNIHVCKPHSWVQAGFSESPSKGLSSPSTGYLSSSGTNGSRWIVSSVADGGICTWCQQKLNILRAVPARKRGDENILEADVHCQALFFKSNIPG